MKTDEVKCQCPSCTRRFRVPRTAIGKLVHCPQCKYPFYVAEVQEIPAGEFQFRCQCCNHGFTGTPETEPVITCGNCGSRTAVVDKDAKLTLDQELKVMQFTMLQHENRMRIRMQYVAWFLLLCALPLGAATYVNHSAIVLMGLCVFGWLRYK